MAITEKTEHFQASLGEFADIARAYGVGKPIREIAETTPEVSLSTLKKLMNGEHIRAKQFIAAAKAFHLRPLDWIELKIRYIEAYLQEYLVKETDYRIRTDVESLDLNEFFELRADPKNRQLCPTRQKRFACANETFFRDPFIASADIATPVGASGKRDMHTVSRQTVDAFRRGEHVAPKKFKRICINLKIGKLDRTISKILYAEAYLGEFLLGEDPAVFKKISFVNYPRTSAVLTYSAENRNILP